MRGKPPEVVRAGWSGVAAFSQASGMRDGDVLTSARRGVSRGNDRTATRNDRGTGRLDRGFLHLHPRPKGAAFVKPSVAPAGLPILGRPPAPDLPPRPPP